MSGPTPTTPIHILDIPADDFDALRRQVDKWQMENALAPVWLASSRTVEVASEKLRHAVTGVDRVDSAFGVPIELDDAIPDGFFRPSCRHAWFNAGYQMQADPPLWLECCRYCPEQRLTPAAPTPESSHPYSGVLHPPTIPGGTE